MRNLRLDKTIALLGFSLSIPLLFFSFTIQKGVGLSFSLLISSVSYLIISGRKVIHEETLRPLARSTLGKLAVYVTITIFLLLFLIFSTSFLLYRRSLEYFLIASIFCIVIATEIYVMPHPNSEIFIWIVMSQILLISVSLRWSIIFEFPKSLIGPDTWYHSFIWRHILETGRLYTHELVTLAPYQISGYSSFPFYDLVVSTTQLLTSLPSLKESVTFSIGTFEVLSLLFVFLISRKMLADVRWALLATLMVGVSNWHITFGYWLTPTSLGLGFFAVLVYLLLSNTSKTHKRNFLLILFFLGAMTLTHTVSSFILVVTIVLSFLAELLFLRRYPRKEKIGIFLALLSVVLLLAYWAYGSNFLQLATLRARADIMTTKGILSLSPAMKSFTTHELDNFGMYVFYGLALMGCLTWFKEKATFNKVMIIVSSSTLILFLYAFWFFGLRSILSERWISFSYVLIAVLAAQGLKLIVNLSSRQKYTLIILSMLFLSFTFPMITSNYANMDSPLYGKSEVMRYSFLDSEIIALDRISKSFNGNVYTDQLVSEYFYWVLESDMIAIDFNKSKFSLLPNEVAIIREYIYERPTQLPNFGSLIRVTPTFKNEIQDIHNIIYCNPEVTVYSGLNREAPN